MKKRKLTLWLNVATLCLCLATLAFGVYSAKQAKLTTNGTVSFKAHDCQVKVVGTISNAMRSESLNYAQVSDKTYTDDGSGNTVDWADSFTTGDNYLTSSDTWTFGDIYFDDMNIGNNEGIKSIIITLQVTNFSEFPVKASYVMPTFDSDANLDTTGSVSEISLDKVGGSSQTTANLILKLTLSDSESELKVQDLNLEININKENNVNATNYGTLSESNGEYSLTLTNSIFKSNANGEVVLPTSVLDSDGVERVLNSVIIRNVCCPYKMIVPEGITSVADLNEGYIAQLELPSTVNSVYGNKLNYVYEVYNKSSVTLTNGSNTIAIHTNDSDASVLQTTSDGLLYYKDTANSKSYLLGLKTTSETITLPQKIDGLDCEIKNYALNNFSGTINITDNNGTYGSNGDVVYKNEDNSVVWCSYREQITIPSNITSLSYNKINSNKVFVDENNSTYASNSDGTLVYNKNDCSILWSSKTVETLSVPEGVKTFSLQMNANDYSYKTLNLPKSLETIHKTDIPGSVTAINVTNGNSKYICNNGVLYEISENKKVVLWSKAAVLTITENINMEIIAQKVTKVVYKADSSLEGSFPNESTFSRISSVTALVFDVANSSIISDADMLISRGGGNAYNISTIFVKNNITEMDTNLSKYFTKLETSEMSGYVQWNRN